MKFLKYFLKSNIIYGLVAIGFSLIGILSPVVVPLNSPISSATIEHIVGHIVWGMMAGIISFSLRGAIIAGSFALILDADHLINFLEIEAISRMAHSIPFAVICLILLPLTWRCNERFVKFWRAGGIFLIVGNSILPIAVLTFFALINDNSNVFYANFSQLGLKLLEFNAGVSLYQILSYNDENNIKDFHTFTSVIRFEEMYKKNI